MGYKTFLIERQNEPTVVLRMQREAERNTLSDEFLDELDAFLNELRWDPNCRVLIITGRGRIFCAGAELKKLMSLDPITAPRYLEKAILLFDKLEQMPQATIAAVNGYALGGGCELALACDFRIMSESARLGLPEVGLGAFPGAGGVQRLHRLIGKAKAMEMVVLGRQLTADAADKLGLLYKRTDDANLMDEALNLANEILTRSPVAINLAKTCMKIASDVDIQTANSYAVQAMCLALTSQDLQEGIQAFFGKRRPRFPGIASHLAPEQRES